jgi:hypothetical protein
MVGSLDYRVKPGNDEQGISIEPHCLEIALPTDPQDFHVICAKRILVEQETAYGDGIY